MDAQVVILAAGQSSRFFPFNHTDKSLYPFMGRPVLAYTLAAIAKTKLTKVIIVTPPGDTTSKALKPYLPPNLQVTYVTLPKPQGQGAAILAAVPAIHANCFVLNSEHFLFDQLLKPHHQFIQSFTGIGLSFREATSTPEKYGIFDLDGDRVKSIIEKPLPEEAPSDQRLVGVYYLTPEFLSILRSVPPSEYNLEAAINTAASTHEFLALPASTTMPSLKYPWDVLHLKDLLLSSTKPFISRDAQIAPTATIRGQVTIESGARVGDYALIEGPAYIGPNALVGAYSELRSGSILETSVELQRYTDVKNSHIHHHTKIHSGFIGDSVIGAESRLAADFLVANRRLDRKSIRTLVKNQPVDTRLDFLGCFLGNNVSAGIRVSLMPGTIIGAHSQITPGTIIKGTHPDHSIITTSNLNSSS